MKTNKLPLTVLFGLLFAVTGGNAFAGEALDQLKDWANNTAPASDVKLAPKPDTANMLKSSLALDTKQLANPAGTLKAAGPPPPAPNPIKEFISENKTTIFGVGLGGFLGFALFGPVGILLGALFMFGFMKMAAA